MCSAGTYYIEHLIYVHVLVFLE